MKTTTIVKAILAAVLLNGSATMLNAQTSTPVCPFGHEPGYGQSLSPEQRAEHRAVMQQYIAELRQKQADGTLTAEEQTWLQQAEQRGGPCVTGAPRGAGAGKGKCAGNGAGQGKRRGLRDGTGPRNASGACPLGRSPRQNATSK